MGQLIKFPVTQVGTAQKSKPVRIKQQVELQLTAEVLFFTGVRYERQMESLPSERLPAPIARA